MSLMLFGLLTACGGSGSEPVVTADPKPETTPPAPSPAPDPEPTPVVGAFIEENGVLVVEMESTDFSGSSWQLKAETSASGGQAIEWTGDDLFNQPGIGVINIAVQITNPGTYRFDWLTLIGEGNSTTEANDSWLKIQSDKFYGLKDNSTVCPKEIDSAVNSCVGELPEGSSKEGWFKVYRSGGDVAQFIWSTSTSDRDPHAIYADFSQAGTYTVQISGRSKHHVIDRFIMTNDPLTHDAAKNFDESARVQP